MSSFVPPPGCWGTIGVSGDRSCPELARVVHCRNCPILQQGGDELLARRPPPGYTEDWTALVARPVEEKAETTSVVMFRIAEEWLAIDTHLVKELAEMRPVHRVAHRTHTLLAGIVNIRGQIHLCVALDRLLEISQEPAPGDEARFVVLEWLEETWVFAASEVSGVVRFANTTLGPAPATLSAALAALTRGMFPWEDKQVAHIHGAHLIAALKRSIA